MIKNRRNVMKMAGIALLAVLALGIGTTWATIRHEMSLTNNVKTPTVEVAIQEELGKTPQDGVKKKEVSFVNNGTADVFLRIAYAEQWTYTDSTTGETIILPNKTAEGNPIATINWSGWKNSDWSDEQDGWYYYKKVVPAAGSIEKVVTNVTFPTSAYPDARYEDADYQLHFQIEAVQASDEWAVSQAAVKEVFEKTITVDKNEWTKQKYNALITWN